MSNFSSRHTSSEPARSEITSKAIRSVRTHHLLQPLRIKISCFHTSTRAARISTKFRLFPLLAEYFCRADQRRSPKVRTIVLRFCHKANRFYKSVNPKQPNKSKLYSNNGPQRRKARQGTQQKGRRGRSHTVKAGRVVKAYSKSTHHMETRSRAIEARQRKERNNN